MHKGRSHGHKTWLELNYMQFRILILLDYAYSLSTKSIVHAWHYTTHKVSLQNN